MFAVIKTGGKQYKVAEADEILIEKLERDAGEVVRFTEVLMLGEGADVTVGAPFVDGASVEGEVVEQTRGPKVISFKKRRRKHSSQRKKGHRQHLTLVRVTGILGMASAAAATASVPAAATMAEDVTA